MFPALLALLGGALAGPLPAAPPQLPASPRLELDTRDFQFPSGMRVVMQPDSTQPVVGVTMVIDKGSWADPPGKEGIAHLVEHLVFRAKHGELPAVWDLLSQLGCSRNASTSNEWTDYRTACRSETLPLMLRLESERLVDAVEAVTDADLDAEREVVRNELRMRAENGFQAILPYTYEMLYPKGDPRGRSVIGSHASLDAITMDDVRAFVKEHYTPENVTIAVVGDFDPELAGHLIAENFALKLLDERLSEKDLRRFPRADVPSPDPDNPEHWLVWPTEPGSDEPLTLVEHTPRIAEKPENPPKPPKQDEIPTYQAPVEYPTVVVAWTLPAGYRENSVALSYLRYPANTAAGSLLPRDAQRRLIGEYSTYGCSVFEGRTNSVLLCRVVPPRSMNREALARKIMNTPMTDTWNASTSTRNATVRQEVLSLERAADIGNGRSTRLAHFVHDYGRTDMAAQKITEINDYTKEQSSELAARWLTRGRARAVLLDPMPAEDRDQASRFEGTGTWRSLEDILAVNEIQPRAIYKNALAMDVQEIEEKTLDSGLRIVVYPHGSIPYVRTALVAKGGRATSKPELASMAPYFINWDDESSDRVGGRWSSNSGTSIQQLNLYGLTANLDNVLYLLRKAVQNRTTAHQDLGTWVRDYKQGIEDNVLWRSYWRHRVIDELLHPGNPAEWNLDHVTADEVKDLDPTQVERWLDSVWRPDNTTLVIVGNVDAGQTLRRAERYFDSWAADKAAAPPPAPPQDWTPPEVDKTVVFDEPMWTQTQVSLSCVTQSGKADNQVGRDLLREIINDRVRALRERDGVTYGGSASVSHWNNGHNQLRMSVLVQNDAVTKAITTFDAAIEEVASGSIDLDTVRAAAWMKSMGRPLEFETQAEIESELLGVIAENGKWDDIAQYPRLLARAQPEQVVAAIGDCAEHKVVTIEGPAESIVPQLEQAGIAYEVFDWRAEGLKVLEELNGKFANRVRKDREAVAGSQ